MTDRLIPGSVYLGEGRTQFCVWAPEATVVELHLVEPQDRLAALQRDPQGYFCGTFDGVLPGSRYLFRIDGQKERPDPASRFQPDGVHAPSEVVALPLPLQMHWHGLPLEDYVTYELHVGTFTAEGTFEAIIPHLDYLKSVGITAIELMPIAQFPGSRNWGYDGAYLYAPQNSYGGPQGLLTLVNACHERGLAVVLDVVYNHLGPEGNYLWDYGPYFTDRYKTPWGSAVNLDGEYSDEVRHFFIENVLYWINTFQIDAFRLDATHALYDFSSRRFLEELSTAVAQQRRKLNREIYLIAESNRNDARILEPLDRNGFGLDAQWSDDFHHAVHTLLTGELDGYYQDFGSVVHLIRVLREGYTYTGEYSPFRKRKHGTPTRQIPASRFVVCTQNHDQIGNRMLGERLSKLVGFESLKLAAGVLTLSPFLPMLFMGEEYGEIAPFPYFVSHSDKDLIEAVRRGRREEFASFSWQGEAPDPQDETTFQSAKLDHSLRDSGQHLALLSLYTELLRLRRTLAPLKNLSKDHQEVIGYERQALLYMRRWHGEEETFVVFNFADNVTALTLPIPEGSWHKVLESAAYQPSVQTATTGRSSIPDQIDASGGITITLDAKSFVLFAKGS